MQDRAERQVEFIWSSLKELDQRLRAMGEALARGGVEFHDFKDHIDAYRERRDFPGVKGPSYLSAHLGACRT